LTCGCCSCIYFLLTTRSSCGVRVLALYALLICLTSLRGYIGGDCRAYSLGTHTRKDEDGLLLEFPCNPTRTRSM
jgi:hypothetical protein